MKSLFRIGLVAFVGMIGLGPLSSGVTYQSVASTGTLWTDPDHAIDELGEGAYATHPVQSGFTNRLCISKLVVAINQPQYVTLTFQAMSVGSPECRVHLVGWRRRNGDLVPAQPNAWTATDQWTDVAIPVDGNPSTPGIDRIGQWDLKSPRFEIPINSSRSELDPSITTGIRIRRMRVVMEN